MTNIPPIDLLKRQIKRAEQELVFAKETGAAKDDFAVLFTGNWHDSIPRNLILNNQLSPVDKVCWQAIRLTINNPQQPGTAPTNEELALMVNCSGPTITTARQMLRLTRYMTFCSVVRHKGKFLGEIYLLHDEPLSPEETLELDATYIEFCDSIARSGNKATRLRTEARVILRDMDRADLLVPPASKVAQMGERIANGLGNFGIDDLIESNRIKNFNPDGLLTNENKKQPSKEKNSDFDRIKNFNPDQNLTKNNQIKNFNAVFSDDVCSSFWSSSKDNKVIKTRTYAHVHAVEAQANQVGMDDWINSLDDPNEYTSDSLPEYDETGSLKPEGKPTWMLDDAEIETLSDESKPVQSYQKTPEARTQEPTKRPRYTSIDSEAFENTDGFKALLTRFLPEIANDVLDRYTSVSFFGIQPQIPIFARMLNHGNLEPLERRDVLLQFLGRKASYVHGWSHEDVLNPIGYLRTLIARIKNGTFIPDSFCAELIRALQENTPPVILDTQDTRQRTGQYVDFNN